ncbi:unnamed protein product [Boreogadus saida]
MSGRSLHRATRARPDPPGPRVFRAPQDPEDPPETRARTGPGAWQVYRRPGEGLTVQGGRCKAVGPERAGSGPAGNHLGMGTGAGKPV